MKVLFAAVREAAVGTLRRFVAAQRFGSLLKAKRTRSEACRSDANDPERSIGVQFCCAAQRGVGLLTM